MQTTVRVEADGAGVTTAHITGELDIESVPEFDEAVRDCLNAPECKQIRVNLAGVTFCDSTGLGALVALNDECGQHGVDLVIEEPHPRVERVIALTGLRDTFKIEP